MTATSRIFTIAALCLPLFAVDTKVWVENEMSDLEKGEITHLSRFRATVVYT